MDTMYQYSVSWLYPQLSAEAVKRLGWWCRLGHLDSTSFHVEGRYHSHEVPEEGVIHLTQGYSRDHRPDLNPVVLPLVTERQAGLPLLMLALAGNNRDKVSFRQMVQQFIQQIRDDFGLEYLVADSAWDTAENLQSMDLLWWIARVSETLGLAQEVIEVCAPEWRYPPTKSAFRRLEVESGEVKQRWVVVFSPEAYQRASKTLNQPWLKQSQVELHTFNTLCK